MGSKKLELNARGFILWFLAIFLVNVKCHYANYLRALYCNFHGCKNGYFQMKKCDIFLIFDQNINRGYMLKPPHEAALTSTHDVCCKAQIRKKCIPCKPQF